MPVQIDPFLSYETGYPDKHLIVTGEQFQIMLNFLECSPAITFDFETSGVRWFADSEACGIGLAGWDPAIGQVQNFYVPFRHQTGEAHQLDIGIIGPGIKAILENESKAKFAHNLKFDEHFAKREGWRVRGSRYDTMVAARLWDENRRIGLKIRAAQDLGRYDADEWEEKVNAHVLRLAKAHGMGIRAYRNQYGYAQVPIPLCGTYGCFDVEFTTRLQWLYEKGGLSQAYPRIWNNEMALTEVLCDMEEAGLPIDVDYLEALRDSLKGVKHALQLDIEATLGSEINLGSDDEIRTLLRALKCPLTKKTKGGQFSVDREVLQSFQAHHPILAKVLEWRDAEKLYSTYTQSILDRIDSNNILHADFQQAGTDTGRLSCREPNFQNQPTDNNDRAIKWTGHSLEDGGIDPWSIRRAYVTRPEGIRLYFDYSQIELRVMAFYSRDPIMVEAYLKGEDIHSRTSLEVFGTTEKAKRRDAKVLNFGLSYGMTERGFAYQTKKPLEEAAQYMDKFFERYHGIKTFRESFWGYVRQNQCRFQNLFGRPRHLPGIISMDKWSRLRAERQAIATLIQGTAAELTKESLVRIWRAFKEVGLEAQIVSTVHDEIQVDCQTHELVSVCRIMKEAMEAFPEFDPIPVVVDGEYTTTSWADKKDLPPM